MLRVVTPGRYIRRTATADVELGGQAIREGDMIAMNFTVANFDPKMFPDPLRFDIDRNPNDSLAFSYGPHRCIGIFLARLEGRVVDQNGAPIAGAKLTLVDRQRGVVRTTISDRDGMYSVQLLRPGTYDQRVEAQGFQVQILTGVVLTVGQIGVRNIQLQIGQLNTEINVSVSPSVIDPTRTQQSDTIESRQIATLPNLTRNFTSYIFTLPGVADVSAARIQQSRVTPIPTSGFSFGAASGRSNYVSIDEAKTIRALGTYG
jgi:hypothetical protein